MQHSYLDRITALEAGVRATGVKCVSLRDDSFETHFPGNPIYPGVHLLEGLAQLAGALLTRTLGGKQIAVMASIDRARFSAFVRPGDTVELHVEVEQLLDGAARVRGHATVGTQQVAQTQLTFKLFAAERLIPPEYRPFWERMLATWHGEFFSEEHD
jgi:3-hydroxyacyl-[acyl-carrier-protein] dehydratase